MIRCLAALSLFFVSWAQRSVRDSTIKMFLPAVQYGFYLPYEDLKKRFGPHSQIGIYLGYKDKKNWLWYVQGDFLFGEQVKEYPLLNHLGGKLGVLWDRYGNPVVPNFFERGFVIVAGMQKIFSSLLPSPNPNSGFHVGIGVGYLNHRIHIVAPEVPYLTKDFKKGYDRLSAGFGIATQIGYTFFSNTTLLNFRIQWEGYAFYTQGLRGYQYDVGVFQEQRKDYYTGIRLCWLLPIYPKAPEKFYYW